MSLKQQIHGLVDELPDDSPLLIEVRETLRMNQAIAERAERVNWEAVDAILARVPDAPPMPGDER